MADLEAVLADVSYLMAMEKSKSTPAARASKKIILPEPSIRSVMQKYLEERDELTFDKIYNQKIEGLSKFLIYNVVVVVRELNVSLFCWLSAQHYVSCFLWPGGSCAPLPALQSVSIQSLTGCVPAVVAYQGTTATLQACAGFTYSSHPHPMRIGSVNCPLLHLRLQLLSLCQA
ncbi:hypothetical protein CRENBAI_020000 [Crenichthys baileyi]|uniref:Uncharacterized protein n=1 Tax=Crenichthys baileyi TaxID=28760 RepID=A0AAV9SHJ9_9TELE